MPSGPSVPPAPSHLNNVKHGPKVGETRTDTIRRQAAVTVTIYTSPVTCNISSELIFARCVILRSRVQRHISSSHDKKQAVNTPQCSYKYQRVVDSKSARNARNIFMPFYDVKQTHFHDVYPLSGHRLPSSTPDQSVNSCTHVIGDNLQICRVNRVDYSLTAAKRSRPCFTVNRFPKSWAVKGVRYTIQSQRSALLKEEVRGLQQ